MQNVLFDDDSELVNCNTRPAKLCLYPDMAYGSYPLLLPASRDNTFAQRRTSSIAYPARLEIDVLLRTRRAFRRIIIAPAQLLKNPMCLKN